MSKQDTMWLALSYRSCGFDHANWLVSKRRRFLPTRRFLDDSDWSAVRRQLMMYGHLASCCLQCTQRWPKTLYKNVFFLNYKVFDGAAPTRCVTCLVGRPFSLNIGRAASSSSFIHNDFKKQHPCNKTLLRDNKKIQTIIGRGHNPI